MDTKTYGQWTLETGDDTYTIVNRGDDGVRRFYMVQPGQYGQPIITPEPDLAFAVPTNLTYIDVKGKTVVPTEKISGIICKDGPRFSLSNAKSRGIVVHVNDDGSIQVGEEAWHLATIFSKDRNRIRNYDAYLVRHHKPNVRVLELGDLDLF